MRKVCCRARQTETHSCAHNAVLTSMGARLLPPASSTEPEPCWHVVLEPRWQIAGFCRQQPQPAAWLLLPGKPDSAAPACDLPYGSPLR